MKTSEYIAFTIDRMPKGYIFTYADFITDVGKKEANESGSQLKNKIKKMGETVSKVLPEVQIEGLTHKMVMNRKPRTHTIKNSTVNSDRSEILSYWRLLGLAIPSRTKNRK